MWCRQAHRPVALSISQTYPDRNEKSELIIKSISCFYRDSTTTRLFDLQGCLYGGREDAIKDVWCETHPGTPQKWFFAKFHRFKMHIIPCMLRIFHDQLRWGLVVVTSQRIGRNVTTITIFSISGDRQACNDQRCHLSHFTYSVTARASLTWHAMSTQKRKGAPCSSSLEETFKDVSGITRSTLSMVDCLISRGYVQKFWHEWNLNSLILVKEMQTRHY